MSPREETAFMTNREMIREMYACAKETKDIVGNMKGELSVLNTVQKSQEKQIDGLQKWRNVTITGTIGSLVTAIVAAIGGK